MNMLTQVINLSSIMALEIFNSVNTGAELRLATPLTTAASVMQNIFTGTLSTEITVTS